MSQAATRMTQPDWHPDTARAAIAAAAAAAAAKPAAMRAAVAHLETSKIQQVFEAGFGVDNLLPLWVGESDVNTPDFICRAAYESLRAGEARYTHKRGIPELRHAIKTYTDGLYGLDLDVERISVTQSGMHGIMMCMQAFVEAGDNVVTISPVWPNIVAAAEIMGGEVRQVPMHLEDGLFRLDLDRLFDACDENTKVLFFCSPGNPTAWVMPDDQRLAIRDFCRQRGIWVIADEVYHRLVYDRPVAPSILPDIEPEDRVINLHSFSKTWAMTGWRLGWLVHPPEMGETFGKLLEFSNSGCQAFLQRAATTAITEGEPFVQQMVEYCRVGRDIVSQHLNSMPRVRLAQPTAAFYAFFAVDGMTDSLGFALDVLHKTGVGMAPGAAFGAGGEGFLRICFAKSPEMLAEAMDRLRPVLS
jgi:aspartate/methionine/tyrosine aminotransferase